VAQLVAQATSYVDKALDFELDGTDASLSVLDHYLSQVPAEPVEVAELTAAAVGSYFGEVLRRRFDARWVLPTPDPREWRLELSQLDLSLSPMAVAYQAIVQGADARLDDGLEAPPKQRVLLEEVLARLAPVPEQDYYTLTNRYDTLETIVDALLAHRARQQKTADTDRPPDGP
jgi:hypothetical protein